MSSQMTTEVRSRRSRFRECTSKTRFRGRRRRSHSHLRLNTCLSRFVLPCGSADSGCADPDSGCATDSGCAACGCAACADDADGADGVDGGCAACGCVMTTEFRNPSSRCRGCRKYTGHLDRRRRILHQWRSCRCLSIVPLSGSADGGCECADGADGGSAADSGSVNQRVRGGRVRVRSRRARRRRYFRRRGRWQRRGRPARAGLC